MGTDSERKATGWRIPIALRRRLVSWARGEGKTAEGVAAEWLEDRLLLEEKKRIAKLGRPITEK
jgi:hypothetical protein